MDIPREDLRDKGAVGERINRHIDIKMRTAMIANIFQGTGGITGANQQWQGIMPALTQVPGTNALNHFGIGHNSVAVEANHTEPVAFFETLMAWIGVRGLFPSCIFLNVSNWETVRQSQRYLRNQENDYMAAPWGRIGPIPMCLNRNLGANQALIIDTNDSFDVVLGEEIQTGISEDYHFGQNVVSLRRVVDGNIAIVREYGAVKVTATNLFAAAS